MGLLGKKLIALTAVGAMLLPLGSCGEKYTGERVTYDSAAYSFTVDEGLKIDGEPYEYENEDTTSYSFTGKLFKELGINSGQVHQLTAVPTEKENAESMQKDETLKDVSWEEIKGTPYECAASHYRATDVDEDEGQWFSEYLITYQSRAFTISARYTDKNKKAARAEIERIMKSVSYTSDFMLPTNEQDYTCQLFNFHYGPQWMIERDRGEDLANDVMVDLKFCIAETDDPDQYLFPSAGVKVINNGGTENAADLAGAQYDKNSQSSVLKDVKLKNEEFFGLDAHIVTYTMDSADPPLVGTTYYMDLNDMVYVISKTVHEGSERDEQDIYDLLSGLTIFKLTEQEMAQINQSREEARYYDDTLHGASFIVDGRMKRSTVYDSDDEVKFSNYGSDLYIRVFQQALTPEEIANNDADREIRAAEDSEDMTPEDLKLTVENIALGEYDLVLLTYTEPENFSHSYDETIRRYYLEHDGEKWVFEFTNSPDNEDEMTDFISEFFFSLKFE